MRRHYRKVWAEGDAKLRQKLEAVKRTHTYRLLFNRYLDQYLSRVYGPEADLSTLRTDPEVRRKFAGEDEGHQLALQCQIPIAVVPDAETPEVSDPAIPMRAVPYPYPRKRNPKERVPYLDRIIKDRRFTMVELDLSFSKERLQAEFNFLLASLWPLAEREGREVRGAALKKPVTQPFQVYDLRQKDRPWGVIVREVYPECPEGDPNYEPAIKKVFEKVHRDYLKAKRLIDEAERELQEIAQTPSPA
jgi:hypothetical protein